MPERRWFPLSRWVNRWLYRAQIVLQTGRLPTRDWVVWCYWPAGFLFAKGLNLPGRWVFDADHDILRDDNRSAGTEDEIKQVLGDVVRKADLVVAASRSMLEWFKQNGARRCLFLRNGVDPRRFERRPLARNSRLPRIGYVGTLSRWMDYFLLQEIAAMRPQWRFIIAGSVYRAKVPTALTDSLNVEFVGKVSADQVPEFLATLDIALGLYRKGPGSDVDSMKLFEYLAASVPVVTTPFHDFLEVDFEGLLEFAEDAPAFVNAVETVLGRDESSQEQWRGRCRDFVERNTWRTRADQALSLLQTLVPPR